MKSVLIVEDDPETLAADCKALAGHFLVLAATDGDTALRMARQARPAAIVLDVMLPDGKDGFSVYRDLRLDPATRDTPVVFLTSINRIMETTFGSQSIGRYLGSEPAAFLEKPIAPETLLHAVRTAIGDATDGYP